MRGPKCLIVYISESVNKVRRIGALSWGSYEKAALGTSYRRRVGKLPSGQSQAHPLRLTRGFCGNSVCIVGVTPAPCKASLDSNADIRTFTPQRPDFFGPFWGTTPEHRQAAAVHRSGPGLIRLTRSANYVFGSEMSKDGAVNTNDRASGLIRFTPQESCCVALTGGGGLPK